jgi:hypothetical protein
MSGKTSIPTLQIVLFVNGSAADRPPMQGARHQRCADWLQLGACPTAHPRGIRCSQPASHPSGGRQRKYIIFFVPLKNSGGPVCQEAGVSFNSSSPKTFQEHCKRNHNADFTLTIDPLVFTLNRILKRDITMMSRSETETFIRTPVPICYHPHCQYFAPSGQYARCHM